MKEYKEKLEKLNKTYKLVFMSDITGYPVISDIIKITGVEIKPFAQYPESLEIKFKRGKERRERLVRFLPQDYFALFDAETSLDKDVYKTFNGNVTNWGFAYDKTSFNAVIKSATQEPVFIKE